ncbi:DUF4328 domain-containing protein [Kitasatospora sp. NBC_00374]|uniref:DUF4328 domain-containing protein n=1 Tax=Kitasatospora sp. NBC_00374 TaxID=2975964 RepID=UPI0030E4F551
MAAAAQAMLVVQAGGVVAMAVTIATPEWSAVTYAVAPFVIPLFLGTAVVFLCWFRRCRLNAEVFAPDTHKYGVDASVRTWFIPVVAWWAPRRVTLDMWRASGARGAWTVNAWWITWLAKSAGLVIYGLLHLDEDTFNSPGAAVVSVAASVLAIAVVRQLTSAQRTRIALTAAHGPTA